MTVKTNNIKDKIVNLAYFIFFLGVAIFALYYCFRNIEFSSFIDNLKKVDYLLVFLSILIGVFATAVRALRWNIMIQPLGYKPPFINTCNALMVAYMSNLAIPRAGELIRCASLHKTDKIPINTLFGTVVSERVFDMLCLLIVIVLTFFVKMELFTQFIAEKIAPQWQPVFANISTGTILLLSAAALLLAAGGGWLLYYYLKQSNTTKLGKMISGLFDGVKSIFIMKKKLRFILCTLLIWTCYWYSGYLVFKSLPLTAALNSADALFFLALGTLGWVVPAPGGFGTFHFIVALGLTMYGIPFEPDGISVATLSHESQLLGMVVFGLIVIIYVSLTKIKINKT